MYSYHEYLKPRELFLAWGRSTLIGAFSAIVTVEDGVGKNKSRRTGVCIAC